MAQSVTNEINTTPQTRVTRPISSLASSTLTLYQQASKYNECNGYKKCFCILRLLFSLKYHTLLKPTTNETSKSVFIEFMSDVYGSQILDDFHHLTHIHGQDIKSIMDYAITKCKCDECDMAQCQFSDRHYGVNNENGTKSDTKFNFYLDIISSLHFYIHHLSHAGFRFIENKENMDYKQDDDEISNEEYYDFEFAKRQKMISTKHQRTARFNRLSSKYTNKFTISSNNDDNDRLKQKEIMENGETYLDELFDHLMKMKITNTTISKLKKYIVCEEFDTESINMDIIGSNDNKNVGNIEININDAKCLNVIKHKFNTSRSMFFFIFFCFLCFNLYIF